MQRYVSSPLPVVEEVERQATPLGLLDTNQPSRCTSPLTTGSPTGSSTSPLSRLPSDCIDICTDISSLRASCKLRLQLELFGVNWTATLPLQLPTCSQQQVCSLPAGSLTAQPQPVGTGHRKTLEHQLRARLLEAEPAIAERLAKAGEDLDDACLTRWLRARGGDVTTAKAAIISHAAWRTSLVPSGRIHEVEIRNELACNKVFLQGCTHQGHPVLIVLAARHDMAHRNIEETNQLIAYTLDNAAAAADLRKNELGRFLCLFDLSGLRMNNLDVKALRSVFELLQQHYPERLSALWFLNAPFIFWGLWRIVSPFIQPETRDKIVFLSGNKRQQMLAEHIPMDVLPREYGGLAEMMPIEAAVAMRAARNEAAHMASRAVSKQEQAAHADGRLIAASRTIKRWGGSAWGFLKRGGRAMAAPAHAAANVVRSWRSAEPGTNPTEMGLIQRQFSMMQRKLSMSHFSLARSSASLSRAHGPLQARRPLGPMVKSALGSILMPDFLLEILRQAGRALQAAWYQMHRRPPSITSG